MSIEQLMTLEVRVINRTQDGPDDDFGTPTWRDHDPVTEYWEIQPVQSDEVEDRPAGKFTHRAFAPTTSVVLHTATVRNPATNEQWEVDGPPRLVRNPRTKKAHRYDVDLVGYTEG